MPMGDRRATALPPSERGSRHRECRRRRRTAEIARPHRAVHEDAIDRAPDRVRPPRLRRCAGASSARRAAAPWDWRSACPRCPARCRARLRTRPRLASEVRARAPGPGRRPAGAQIGDDVAVEVRQQQHVELLRPHHEVHAGRVDDLLVVARYPEALRDRARALEEQPVAELHDVGFVDRGDLLAAVPPRVLERKFRDARRRDAR